MCDNYVPLRPLSYLDFGDGKIEFVEAEFDLSASIEDQLEVIHEDLLQVTYHSGNYIVDLGFYGHYPDGRFCIFVVKNYAWEAPIFERRTPEISAIEAAIVEAVQTIYADRKKAVNQQQETS